MRVLVTGMSGSGKSTLVQELRRRGYAAYDAGEDRLHQGDMATLCSRPRVEPNPLAR